MQKFRALSGLPLVLTLALSAGACSPSSSGSGSTGTAVETGGSSGASSGSVDGDGGASGKAAGGSGGNANSTGGTSTSTNTAGGASGADSAGGAAGAAPGSGSGGQGGPSEPGGDDAGAGGSTGTSTGGAAGGDSDGGTAPTPPAPGAAEDPKAFSCTLVIGIAATGQWFGAGFEKIVDNARWEILAVHSGFIQGWADPNSDFWTKAPGSACAMNAKTPDRVIIEALYLHWMDATVDQWVEVLKQAVGTFKAKNPNLKRLELSTFVRAPGDKPCPGSMPFKSWIKPEQDMAYEKIAAMFPGFVTIAPKFEVKSCAAYGGNPPHYGGNSASDVAKMIADHYSGAAAAP